MTRSTCLQWPPMSDKQLLFRAARHLTVCIGGRRLNYVMATSTSKAAWTRVSSIDSPSTNRYRGFTIWPSLMYSWMTVQSISVLKIRVKAESITTRLTSQVRVGTYRYNLPHITLCAFMKCEYTYIYLYLPIASAVSVTFLMEVNDNHVEVRLYRKG